MCVRNHSVFNRVAYDLAVNGYSIYNTSLKAGHVAYRDIFWTKRSTTCFESSQDPLQIKMFAFSYAKVVKRQ